MEVSILEVLSRWKENGRKEAKEHTAQSVQLEGSAQDSTLLLCCSSGLGCPLPMIKTAAVASGQFTFPSAFPPQEGLKCKEP